MEPYVAHPNTYIHTNIQATDRDREADFPFYVSDWIIDSPVVPSLKTTREDAEGDVPFRSHDMRCPWSLAVLLCRFCFIVACLFTHFEF